MKKFILVFTFSCLAFIQWGFASSTKAMFLEGREGSYIYYHSHTASLQELTTASQYCCIFEIDLAYAHSSFHIKVSKDSPYIGHSEKCYTKKGDPFPENNVSLEEFKAFLINNPSVKVLIDIKDKSVFPYLESFIQEIGSDRCLVHAVANNWKFLPADVVAEPHWDQEDIELFSLDALLTRLNVPLIANCRGFSDKHIEETNLLELMINDAKKCKSIVALGFYYPGAPLPKLEYLEKISDQGYFVWVNGNIDNFEERLGELPFIAMCDSIEKCTRF